MTSFDNREKAFEDMYARDAELRFKVLARRDKLLGLWAAGLLGKSADEATEYAGAVVAADLEHPGDEDVIAKIQADLGDLASDEEIRAQLQVAFIEAERQYREAI
jgi:hypothetical protein